MNPNERATEALELARRAAVSSVVQLAAGNHRASLERLDVIDDDVEAARAEIVASWRLYGASWADVAAALGMTRQAAWARYSGRHA